MAYNYEYPYTDPGRSNSDWLINKMKQLEEDIIGIEEAIFSAAKDYIDIQMAPYEHEIAELRADFERFVIEANANMQQFENTISANQVAFAAEIRATVIALEARIAQFQVDMRAEVQYANVYTDLAISQNNDALMEELGKGLGKIRVVNFFTGQLIPVQEMFDYLASLHVTDGLTYTEFAGKQISYSQLAALGISYTDLVLHAKTIIV